MKVEPIRLDVVCERKKVNSYFKAFGATKTMALSFVDMAEIVKEAGLGVKSSLFMTNVEIFI